MGSFHEKQQLWQCGVHSLNNLFQEQWASREMLDGIAADLHRRDREMQAAGFFNPYKSAIPYLGYYDIGVLVAALELKDACLTEHFAVAAAMTVERLQEATANCIGIVVNVETTTALVFKGKHWFTILKVEDNSFMNLDSKIESPVSFPDVQELHAFLLQQMERHHAHVFVVSHKETPTPAEDESKS